MTDNISPEQQNSLSAMGKNATAGRSSTYFLILAACRQGNSVEICGSEETNDYVIYLAHADREAEMLGLSSIEPDGMLGMFQKTMAEHSMGLEDAKFVFAYAEGEALEMSYEMSSTDLMDYLMERIVDDMDDEDENTDDHPWEEVRTALLDLEDSLASKPSAP